MVGLGFVACNFILLQVYYGLVKFTTNLFIKSNIILSIYSYCGGDSLQLNEILVRTPLMCNK